MSCENSFLAHHGIIGQHWGVRRFQNKDGSLTTAGRIRYGHLDNQKINKAKDKVDRFKTIANPDRFRPDKIDLALIQKRGDLTVGEAKRCAELATYIFDRARIVEPKVTNDVLNSVKDNDAFMYGLDNRLKQPNSLASKIGAKSKEKNISLVQASESINDVIRYTTILGDDSFINQYEKIKKDLYNKGYNEIKCRNYFSLFEDGKVKHKSVQCIYINNDGIPFEIQYQTTASQAVKNLKIPLYEEARNIKTGEKRKKQIEQMMYKMAMDIPNPKNIQAIKSYG